MYVDIVISNVFYLNKTFFFFFLIFFQGKQYFTINVFKREWPEMSLKYTVYTECRWTDFRNCKLYAFRNYNITIYAIYCEPTAWQDNIDNINYYMKTILINYMK